MKQFLTKLILVFTVLLLNSACLHAQSKYVKTYRHLADSLGKAYGIPPAIILGVAIIESSSGTEKKAKLLNNHFGIIGKNNLLKTKRIKTRYKAYPNVKASYIDFCKVLMRKRFYPRLKYKKDINLWADAISKSGYTEKPLLWKKRIVATIHKHRL
ncbi:MAG: hypothetical protein RLY16_1231 [Bacteroidota bacterium]|jgi:flagellum-specific peptidoglycan hydrolase FlgJ